MTRNLILLVTIFSGSFHLFGQNSATVCKVDTFHILLAYETGDQCFLGDMILKNQELVRFDNKNINLKTYEDGIFHIPSLLDVVDTSWYKFKYSFKKCKTDIDIDSLFANGLGYPFDSLDTKEWSKTNYTFKGKGETMLGEKINLPPITFTYKIFDISFVAVYFGKQKRNIVNIDRQTKKEEEFVTITCPVYYILKFTDIQTIKK